MEVRIKGQMTIADIRQALFEQLHDLETKYAVQFSRGATLYINPTNAPPPPPPSPIGRAARTGISIIAISSGSSVAFDFSMHSAITGVGFESGIENVLWVWIHAGLDGL